MQLIQNGSQGPTTLPTKQSPTGTPGYGYGGPPGATPSSILDPDVFNTLLAELINIVLAGGLTLDPADNGQVLKALRRIGFPTGLGGATINTTFNGANAGTFYNIGTFGGAGIIATLNTSAFVAGQTIGFLAFAASTIVLSAGAFYGGSITGSSITMPVNSLIALQFDGVNWRQLAGSFTSGRLLNVQVFTTPGTFTYTPTAGTNSIIAEVQAAGGGGGGCAAPNNAALCAIAGGGSAGTYGRGRFTSGFSGQTITVGAGGAGGAVGNTTGGAGGSSSLGTLLSCPGGGGGIAGVAFTPPSVTAGGTSSGAATGANINQSAGSPGSYGIGIAPAVGAPPTGGSSAFSSGAVGAPNAAANPGIFGAGASGLFLNGADTVGLAGANGGAGIVLIWEYA